MIKSLACLAIVGSAAAYVPPMMSLSANRREVMAGAAAASVIAPLAANARIENGDNIKAPFITLFDNRGCSTTRNNYKGELSGTDEDQLCIKLTMESVIVSKNTAAKKLQEFIGLKETAIGVEQIRNVEKQY